MRLYPAKVTNNFKEPANRSCLIAVPFRHAWELKGISSAEEILAESVRTSKRNVFVRVCVCVCVRERERENGTARILSLAHIHTNTFLFYVLSLSLSLTHIELPLSLSLSLSHVSSRLASLDTRARFSSILHATVCMRGVWEGVPRKGTPLTHTGTCKVLPFLGLPLTQKLKRTPCPSALFSLSLSLSLSHTYIQIHCSSTSFLFSLSLSLTQLPLVLFLIQIFLAEWRHWCDQYLLGKRSRLVFVESRRVCLVGVDQ